MNEERCILCNRPYDYDRYELFGRGCLSNLYSLLNISKPPRGTKDREMYLCNKIAHRNFKFFLNKKKKHKLAEKYIALKYLDKIDFNKYSYVMPRETKDIDYNQPLEEIKEKISKDIKKISVFYKDTIDSISFKLNEVYELSNYAQKFEEIINSIKNIDWEKFDEVWAEKFIENLSFVFDTTKKYNPITYVNFYIMQYLFWEIVVIGGLLAEFKLSAALLQKSLVNFGAKSDEEIEITDEEITDILKNNEEFKEKIDEVINEYEGDTIDIKNYNVVFNKKDLLLAIHKATLNIIGNKNSNDTWDLTIELVDTYDYTEFESLKEYSTLTNSIPISIFSTMLNNFAVASSEYGVIKPYKFTIKFEINNHIVNKVGVSDGK